MRRTFALFAPVSLAVFALVACEEDGYGPEPIHVDASVPDAYSPPVPPGDAGSADADADADAAAPPGVTVTVLGKSGPKASVPVVFHDEDGGGIEAKLTGADGKATSSGPFQTMATALMGGQFSRQAVTWTGVEPGDELTIRYEDPADEVGSYDVSPVGPVSGATTYHFQAGQHCTRFASTLSAPVSIFLHPGCVPGASGTVLAIATTLTTGVPLGYAFKKGNPIPASNAIADVTLGPWTTATSPVVLKVENFDEFVSTTFDQISAGAGFPSGARQGNANDDFLFDAIDGFADQYQAAVVFKEDLGPGVRRVMKRFTPAATVSLDLGGLLPAISGVELDESDPERVTMRWEGATSDGVAGGLVRLSQSGRDDVQYSWTFVVRPGTAALTTPKLNAQMKEFLPPADDGWTGPDVLFIASDAFTDYDAFRRQQGAVFGASHGLDGERPIMPMNGSFSTTMSAPFAL